MKPLACSWKIGLVQIWGFLGNILPRKKELLRTLFRATTKGKPQAPSAKWDRPWDKTCKDGCDTKIAQVIQTYSFAAFRCIS
jgi:hypothetical protein